MNNNSKVTSDHLRRLAFLYIRQSSLHQVQDNRESTARQYGLKRRAQALGWTDEQIVVIDEDQGLSGASAAERSGFQRLVAEVGLGKAGVVMGLEVSRFARSCTDWHRLLEICALSDTLIMDEDGIYDPSHFNDRLLLGLKGTMSEAELHVLSARLLGGQLNKARRGELWMRSPIGFISERDGRLALDPDAQVQGAVRLLFDTFRRTGSAERVVWHFRHEGVEFPRRLVTGPRAGQIVFVPLAHSRVLQILHNPRYAGAYVYGRTRQRKLVADGTVRNRRLAREQWKVFIPNAYPGYISWQQYEANQAKLLENAHGYGWDRCKSPAREGVALLQGLAICGRCGKRMAVRYHVYKGHPVPQYVCVRESIQTGGAFCQSIAGTTLDKSISEILLKAVTPDALKVAFEVFEELRARRAESERQRRAQVQRARQDAELAQSQYLLVRPENRLVADNLEKQWNDKLRALAQAEEQYNRAGQQHGTQLGIEDRDRIMNLASDLPKVWNDPRTPARERKRMLRLLIEDVTLLRDETIRIQIRWKAGATTTTETPLPLAAPDLRRTPAAIVEMVRGLAVEQTDEQIAQTLNNRSLRSGTGLPFTSRFIRYIRNTHRIESFFDRFRCQGWLTVPEMATRLGVHPCTAKRFAQEGVVRAIRANDKGEILFEPPTGPLPIAQPGKRFTDRRVYSKLASHGQNEVQYEA
jgi:DNA invertase Pin-like site-specific DNA recombinase